MNLIFMRHGEATDNVKGLISDKENTVLIVSHGSITSYIKRILNVKSEHLKKGKIDIFNDVDFNNLYKHNEVLKK